MIQLTLILNNLRSTYNVGVILRTADCVGVEKVICCGTTPYPRLAGDQRDPVVINRNTRSIAKTALGAEATVPIEYIRDAGIAIGDLSANGWTIYGLEQASIAQNLFKTKAQLPAALIVGSEVDGLPPELISQCQTVLEIPQYGSKESLNVAVATSIALYHFLVDSR